MASKKIESAGRGMYWITMLVHRCIRHIEDSKHKAWRKRYYGAIAAERRAKMLARKGKGRIVV